MSDTNPTTSPDNQTPELSTMPSHQGEANRQLLIIGGIGCSFLLCMGLLAGGLFIGDTLMTSFDREQAAEVEEVTAAVVSAAENEIKDNVPTPAVVTDPPEMNSITFALETTAEGEPVDAGFAFEQGITQIHAVFEYANLTADDIWTQVWYHNGNEVSNTSQPWLEAQRGVFDYVIEAGGQPLPPGQWALEFYINGELLTAGSFMIEGADENLTAQEIADPVEPVKIYKLAYTRWNGEKHELYVGDTNGSVEQYILRGAAGPSWGPGGRYLFFYGEEGVDQQYVNGNLIPLPGVANGIVRMNASPLPAGVGQIQLFQGHGWNDGTARWANVSPDGSMIAYDGDRGGGRRIYFLGTTANQQFRYEIIGEQADWSPDSQQIVYRSGRNNQFGLWISNRTDSGHTRLTADGSDSFPAWSADGRTIAFSREVGGNVDIYTVDINGSNLQRLTDTPGHDTLPEFLPNGDLVFRSARTGSWGIWKMKGDGSDQIEIIPNAAVGPEWSFSRMGVLP